MASIINALRNLSSDSLWFPKILIMSIPIFCVLNSNIIEKYSFNDQLILYLCVAIVYLGVIGFMMNRNINNISPILPSFLSLPDYFAKTIGMTLVHLPLLLVYVGIIEYIKDNLIFEPFVMFVIYTCVTLFLSPFIFIPAVLYSANGKLKDAFNYKIIFEAAGNFSVGFLLYIIEYAFTLLILTYLFVRLFTEMLEDNTAVNIVYSVSFVVSLLATYSYFSDMYDEQIPRIPDKKKKKNQLKQPDETEIIY